MNCLPTFSGLEMLEYNFGRSSDRVPARELDFRNGKMYPNARPGLGIAADKKPTRSS